jgi:predicted metal-dependent hydrolase
MSARSLLEDLRRQGIRLEPDGLTLRVSAPKEVATGELRATLREHKRDLSGTSNASAGGSRKPTAGASSSSGHASQATSPARPHDRRVARGRGL